MPYTPPTRDEMAVRAYLAFRQHLKGSDAALWPNNVAATAKVLGEIGAQVFTYVDYKARQRFISTADTEGLELAGADLAVPRKPASYAEGVVRLTGTTGTVLSAGSELVRVDGLSYTTLAAGTVDTGGILDVEVRASETGKTYNALPGVTMTLTAAVAGITSTGEVGTEGIGLGADTEGNESFRSRLLFRNQYVPAAGAPHDYVRWAREVPGVSRAFVDPVSLQTGRTDVGVWFMTDELTPDGIPLDADVDRVTAYLESVVPAPAPLSVQKPVAVSVDVTITGLSDDTAATRTAIFNELADMFRRDVAVSTLMVPITVYYSRMVEAISRAAGEHHHMLTAPSGDVVLNAGEIGVLGNITYA